MPFTRHLMLLLATASLSSVFVQSADFNNKDMYPPGTFDHLNVDWSKVNYPGGEGNGGQSGQSQSEGNGDQSGQSQSGTNSPGSDSSPVVVQDKHAVVDTGDRYESSSSSAIPPVVTSGSGNTDSTDSVNTGQGTTYKDKEGNGQGNGNDDSNDHGDNGDQTGGGSGKDCPDGCAMKIRFTKNSKSVDFAVAPPKPGAAVKAVANPQKGVTKDSCICVTEGNPRVSIGTNNPDDHTTLVEVNSKEDIYGNKYYDVSYVEGFSLPVVCWSTDRGQKTMSGHNQDLFATGKNCDNPKKIKQSSGEEVTNCENPGYTKMNAPGADALSCWRCTNPSPFFAPASGAAYTYPFDDEVCASGPKKQGPYHSPMATGTDVECCVGTSCPNNTMSTGGMTAMGSCNPVRNCTPCGPEHGNHEPVCTSHCENKKRDLQSIIEEVAEKRKARKRHAHHQHHAAHGST